MIIRDAIKKDIPFLLKASEILHYIHSPFAFKKAFKRKYFDGVIMDPNYHVIVATYDEIPCAYLLARKQYDVINKYYYCHIIEVFVVEAKRGKNIGKKLINNIVIWSKKENVKEITANVFIGNVASEKIFTAYMFKPQSIKFIKHI